MWFQGWIGLNPKGHPSVLGETDDLLFKIASVALSYEPIWIHGLCQSGSPLLVIGTVWLMDCNVLLSNWFSNPALHHQFSAQTALQQVDNWIIRLMQLTPTRYASTKFIQPVLPPMSGHVSDTSFLTHPILSYLSHNAFLTKRNRPNHF